MKDKGRYVEIPAGEYLPIEQACLILKSAKEKETARKLLEFVKTPQVKDIFRRYGFAVGQ